MMRDIKGQYDTEADALYVLLVPDPRGSIRTVTATIEANVDLAEDGAILGIELLGVEALADA